MNKKMKSELKNYLSKIRKSLPCSFNAKQAFIFMLKSQIKSYFEENPDATFKDVINNFGTPEAITSEFDVNDFETEIKRYKLKTFVLSILVVVFIALCTWLTIALIASVEGGTITVTRDYDITAGG